MNTEYIINHIFAFVIGYILTTLIIRLFFTDRDSIFKILWIDVVLWVIAAIGIVILSYHSIQETFFEHKEVKETPFKEEEWRNKWKDTVKTEKVIVDSTAYMTVRSYDVTLSDGRVKTLVRVVYDTDTQYFLIDKSLKHQ